MPSRPPSYRESSRVSRDSTDLSWPSRVVKQADASGSCSETTRTRAMRSSSSGGDERVVALGLRHLQELREALLEPAVHAHALLLLRKEPPDQRAHAKPAQLRRRRHLDVHCRRFGGLCAVDVQAAVARARAAQLRNSQQLARVADQRAARRAAGRGPVSGGPQSAMD